jgi:hypothetical protein
MKLIDGVENVDEPKQGMVFNSLDELALHYRKYGKQQGFGVVQKNKRKNTSGHTCYITLSCARQGTRKASSNTRTGCKACLNARLVDTKWYVTNVFAKHNHDLSPGKARYFRCNKNLDSTAKRKLLINDRAGISMSKSYNSLAVEAGGMSTSNLVKKIAVISLPSQGIFVLAQEALELFVTISKGCKQLIIISTLPLILMMIVG